MRSLISSTIAASLVCLNSLTGTFALPIADSQNPVIDLGYAKYEGVRDDTLNITTYYALQYAVPPTGSLRWQRPVPVENSSYAQNLSSSIINATAPVYECVQSYIPWEDALGEFIEKDGIDFTISNVTQSEDCLRLDVTVPNSPASSSLPVVIQIHGGGYAIGNSQTYAGPYFTSFSNGSIVYVSIQYRLGFYGFLGNEAVREDGTANAGILDQRAAIEWVQRNIKTFGGDPDQVTIWGGSAGGGSVTAQMQLYGGVENPPFRAAIAEYPWWEMYHNDTILEIQYQQLLNASNCTDLSCLRGLSFDALMKANQATYDNGFAAGTYAYGDYYAGPSIDHVNLLTLPSLAFSSGNFSKVPLLTDHDAYEGVLFSNFSITTESEVQPTLETLWQTNDPAFFTRLSQLYPPTAFGASFTSANPFLANLSTIQPSLANNTAYYRYQAIFGDFIIACPTYYISAASIASSQPVYKLIFAAGSELHSATAPFLLGPNAAPGVNSTIAAAMKRYFLNFVVDLDPNGRHSDNTTSSSSLPNWPSYLAGGEAAGFQILRIGDEGITEEADPDASDRCDFFHGNPYVVRN